MATKIVIDAGHNGLSDPGAVYNGRRESDDTLRLAMAVGEILSRSGYDVFIHILLIFHVVSNNTPFFTLYP